MQAAPAVLLPLRPLLFGPFSPSPREGTGASPRHNGMGGKGRNPGGWEAKGVRGPCPAFALLLQPYISPGTRVTAAPPAAARSPAAWQGSAAASRKAEPPWGRETGPASPAQRAGCRQLRYHIPGLGSCRARRSATEPQEMFHKPLSSPAGAGARCERNEAGATKRRCPGQRPLPHALGNAGSCWSYRRDHAVWRKELCASKHLNYQPGFQQLPLLLKLVAHGGHSGGQTCFRNQIWGS